MKQSIRNELRQSSERKQGMIGRTLRLPTPLDREINAFCEETGINRSVLYRRIVAEGWKVLKEDE